MSWPRPRLTEFKPKSNTLRQCDSGTNLMHPGSHIGADAGIKLPVIVQYPQSFFAHFLTAKEFGGGVGEVEA